MNMLKANHLVCYIIAVRSTARADALGGSTIASALKIIA
jgi:hypothetical protein